MKQLYSNIVPEDIVRDVQNRTLKILAEAVNNSYGPRGSSTAIITALDDKNSNIDIDYTKDGYTIVRGIRFVNPLERSVQELLTQLTQYVVKEVGDGTTSAVIICSILFDHLCKSDDFEDKLPSSIISRFDKVIKEVQSRIENKSWECTLEDIYNIALISTNNNEEIAAIMKNVYEKYGLDCYIDVGISSGVDTIIKEYDGMTLETGYADMCFVNNKSNNSAYVRNPKIYCFYDPIDTPEMVSLFNKIICDNILNKLTSPAPIATSTPTVILCKKITPDISSAMETVVKYMNSIPDIPLLIVSDIHQDYLFEDISKMCGAPFIKKYLNPDLQAIDMEKGLAPTLDNIVDFCGSADAVQSDSVKTKILRPAKMFNEDGSYSDDYNMMVSYLESQVTKCEQEQLGIRETATAKRRLNCFKGNMIDLLVGGMTLADRNNLKASVEDAVLNCRSASINGVGYGASFMAYSVLTEMLNEDNIDTKVVRILYDAYEELLRNLYSKSYTEDRVDEILKESILLGTPFNIKTEDYDGKVLSSIKSDIAVLEAINKVLTMMYTCNQYLLQNPAYNMYVTDKK